MEAAFGSLVPAYSWEGAYIPIFGDCETSKHCPLSLSLAKVWLRNLQPKKSSNTHFTSCSSISNKNKVYLLNRPPHVLLKCSITSDQFLASYHSRTDLCPLTPTVILCINPSFWYPWLQVMGNCWAEQIRNSWSYKSNKLEEASREQASFSEYMSVHKAGSENKHLSVNIRQFTKRGTISPASEAELVTQTTMARQRE